MVINKGRNALHDFGASCTYLRRYALLSILCLVADVDTDGAADEPPAAANAAPASKPKPKPAPTPAKTPAADADPADTPLSADERKLVLALMKDLPAERLQPILEQFRQQFNVKPDVKVSAAITTQAHLQMLQAAMEG